MATKWKTLFNCDGCKHYRVANSGCDRFCHYATDTGRCRVVNGMSVPAEKCFKDRVFFEAK